MLFISCFSYFWYKYNTPDKKNTNNIPPPPNLKNLV